MSTSSSISPLNAIVQFVVRHSADSSTVSRPPPSRLQPILQPRRILDRMSVPVVVEVGVDVTSAVEP